MIYIYFLGINYKTTTLLLDGKRIKLQLWYAADNFSLFCWLLYILVLFLQNQCTWLPWKT